MGRVSDQPLNGGDFATQVVGAAGIEPATLGLEIQCSIRLSYAPILLIQQLDAFTLNYKFLLCVNCE